ncbi:MAG: glycosyltransferase [Chloroflexi bacterium]|jgi:chlorobactene glucosyltransferase|nr:glycosyltransferase [Anaerolineaceae bacterium]NLI44271.1 glycosyltransferase [Chloroflexota bacterium]HOE34691.1 glycosyltransferase [Anaerolineaceae bacterium]HOT25760.1 glycosyltransferase [Anaerolineaceae bacterium]HQH57965.1 glycosyltransferase [Anaerolineaceae bacterium]
MGRYLAHDAIVHFILFQSVLLLVLFSNLLLLRKARRGKHPRILPRVSILVPARNEEKNIARLVNSLLAQDYPDFEVLVLDDESTDGTYAVLASLAQSNPKIRVLRGAPATGGLTGKNWACAQLASQATGEVFLFTDADTVYQPNAVRELAACLTRERADFLTGFPGQELGSCGEKLLVPFFSWAVLNFIWLWLAYRLRWKALAVGIGQVMVFRREAYEKIGGHAGLGEEIVDDRALAQKVIAAGLRWRAVHLSDLVRCRMYFSAKDAMEGFSKNYFAAFDFAVVPYVFVYLYLFLLSWLPWLVILIKALGAAPAANWLHLGLCVGLSLLLWLLPFAEVRVPLRLALLYPILNAASTLVALRSLVLSLSGRLAWKGRSLRVPRWKWF